VKSGFVALAGRPNVGKSTLVNAICGGKVAIVSDKPQTTRHRIHGVANGDGWQLVLVDLPGFQRPLDALTERMQRAVDTSLDEVDAVCLVLAADERIGAGDGFAARRSFAGERPVVIALNKVDRVGPGEIARQIQQAAVPEGPAYFPDDALTDLPLELRIAELVREQVLARTRDEVPHAVTVEVEELSGRRVVAAVLVETRSQKQILVGKGGSMIRDIGTDARAGIEELVGHPVFLDLRVKVKDRWRRDAGLLERLGL
jgi:GTPase